MKRSSFAWPVIAFSLAGCAAQNLTAQSAEWIDEQASRDLVCDGREDCALKWRRAGEWLDKHSFYGIETRTDHAIETRGPQANSARPAYRVNMIPLDGERARISVKAWCNNVIGCVPKVKQAEAVFGYYVMEGIDLSSPPA